MVELEVTQIRHKSFLGGIFPLVSAPEEKEKGVTVGLPASQPRPETPRPSDRLFNMPCRPR